MVNPTFITESVVGVWLAAAMFLVCMNALGLWVLWRILKQVQTPTRIVPTQPVSVPDPQVWAPPPSIWQKEQTPAAERPLFTVWDAAWFNTKMNLVQLMMRRQTPNLVLEQELLRAQRDLREIAECHPDHPDSLVLIRRAEKVQNALSNLFELSAARLL